MTQTITAAIVRACASVVETHPGCVGLVRVGDDYAACGDDAFTLNGVLGLGIDAGPGNTPTVRFPVHALERALKSLLAAGHRIAICESVDPPALTDPPAITKRIVSPPPSIVGGRRQLALFAEDNPCP